MRFTASAVSPARWPAMMCDREAADYCGVGKTTLWKLVAAGGDFPKPVRVPGTTATRFRRADLDEWVESLKPVKVKKAAGQTAARGEHTEEVHS